MKTLLYCFAVRALLFFELQVLAEDERSVGQDLGF